MRKMMNKKGFSLVELMIVVVIMGILIAVAIPLYGAITDNAKNKTCATNVDNIRANARNYFLSYTTKATDVDVEDMMEEGKLPDCPWDGEDEDDYKIWYNGDGTTYIECANQGVEGHDEVVKGTKAADATAGANAA